MQRLRVLGRCAAWIFALSMSSSAAHAVCSFDQADVTAEDADELCPQLVDISKDCLGRSAPECFEDPGAVADFSNWYLSIVTRPIAERPLLVRIGAGTFTEAAGLTFICLDNLAEETLEEGYTTVRGAGRNATTLDLRPGPGYLFAQIGLVTWLCHEMHFSDMTVISEKYGVAVAGGGDTTWSRMDVEAGSPVAGFSNLNVGWQEENCRTRPDGGSFEHYLFDTRIRLRAKHGKNIGYHAPCDHNWFFAGEIEVTGDASRNTKSTDLIGVDMSGGGRMVVFDSRIHVATDDFTTGAIPSAAGITGVHMVDHLEFHMHGGLISVDASTHPGANATVIHADHHSHAHLFATESRVTAGPPGTSIAAGTPRRLFEDGGEVQATQFWGGAADPPKNDDRFLLSTPGSDLFVETDCDASGDCDAAGNEAHLMIMNAELCGDPDDVTEDPWFDAVAKSCRTP